MKETGKRMRRQLALLVVTALLAGMLPVGTPTAGKAATSDPAEKTTRESYGLNNPSTNADSVTTWDCVWFGNYWQEDTNGDGTADKNDQKTSIKWRVLSVDGDDAFLLADQNLDCQKYNGTFTSVTWETCTMRSWLNGYGAEANKDGKDYSDSNFLNNAFSTSEQSAIRTTDVVNDVNPSYGTEGGNNTSDKVYLLSIDEVTNPAYGFSSDSIKYDEARRAKNTEYAKAQGAWTNSDEEYAGNGVWWLRSPGNGSSSASGVGIDGYVPRCGYNVDHDFEAARAALHLNLSSLSSWSYAGTVTSDGKVEEPESTPAPEPSASVKPSARPDVTPTVTPVETTNPGTDPTATPDVGQTPAPTATADITPTNQPDVPATADPHATATPAATTDPGTDPTATPDASQTPAPTATADITPTNQPDVPPTADPHATPTATPGAAVPLPQPPFPQPVAPVLQPPVVPSALTGIGTIPSVKLKQKKQAVTVSWKKVSGADGYQVCYSTSKKWKKKKQQKLTRNNMLTVKKLKKKKTYYFRVRAYCKNGMGKIYGAWSKTKKIKIKKKK